MDSGTASFVTVYTQDSDFLFLVVCAIIRPPLGMRKLFQVIKGQRSSREMVAALISGQDFTVKLGLRGFGWSVQLCQHVLQRVAAPDEIGQQLMNAILVWSNRSHGGNVTPCALFQLRSSINIRIDAISQAVPNANLILLQSTN